MKTCTDCADEIEAGLLIDHMCDAHGVNYRRGEPRCQCEDCAEEHERLWRHINELTRLVLPKPEMAGSEKLSEFVASEPVATRQCEACATGERCERLERLRAAAWEAEK